MSRCFKEEICFGTQQQLTKCDLEFFFFHFFVASEIMNGAGSGEKKEERGEKANGGTTSNHLYGYYNQLSAAGNKR